MIHSLVISALAWNRAHSQGGMRRTLKNNFYVEAVFEQGTRESHLSPAVHPERSDQLEKLVAKSGGKSTHILRLRRFAPTLRMNGGGVYSREPFKKPVQKKSQAGNQTPLFASTPPLTSASSEAGDSLPFYNPPPVYPREARRRKIQGVVRVQVFLTETGEVDKIVTLPPRTDPLLEEAALKAIYKWKFKSGARTVEVPIEFKLMV
jgi:TonB family protein